MTALTAAHILFLLPCWYQRDVFFYIYPRASGGMSNGMHLLPSEFWKLAKFMYFLKKQAFLRKNCHFLTSCSPLDKCVPLWKIFSGRPCIHPIHKDMFHVTSFYFSRYLYNYDLLALLNCVYLVELAATNVRRVALYCVVILRCYYQIAISNI